MLLHQARRLGQRVVASREQLAFTTIALVCWALTVWLFAPGHMSLDSVDQLEQARAFAFNDRHPVSMALLWHVVDRLWPGPLGMLMLFNLLYWFGLSVFMRTRPWPVWVSASALPLLGFFPPVFAITGAIWKDTLMQAALLAAVGCALAARSGRTRARRIAWYVAFGVLVLTATTVRHNALAAVWPLIALVLFELPILTRLKLGVRALGAAFAALGASVVATALALKLLGTIAEPVHFWQMFATFDLAGIAVRTGELSIDRASGVLHPRASLREVKRAYNPFEHLHLYHCLRKRRPCFHTFTTVDDPERLAILARDWRREVFGHPREYLAHRAAVFERAVAFGRPAKLWFLKGVRLAKDYPPSRRAKTAWKWLSRQAHTPWFKVWCYLLLGVGCAISGLVFLVRTRSALPLALALSCLSYAASIFFGTGAPDYRYSAWSVTAALLALLALLGSWRRVKGGAREAYFTST